ncbi:hemerythrin domain-containing protein [Blastococcus sp. SYSU D00820]
MTTTPATDERPHVHDMVVAHRVFRHELGMLPALVGGTAEGDRARAGVLADHYRFVTDVLHHHHSFEDEHFWPVLLQRCPMDAALIERMEEQHERVAALLAELPPLWAAWTGDAGAADRDRLAARLAALSAALEEHLHDEEVHLLPIMEQHLSVAEWNAFGDSAAKAMDKKKGLYWLGVGFDLCDDAERERLWHKIPGWARVLWRLAGERVYRRQLARVRGTA